MRTWHVASNFEYLRQILVAFLPVKLVPVLLELSHFIIFRARLK